MAAYLFLLPTLIGYAIFIAGPTIAAFTLSLCKWDVLTPPNFTGLSNFRRLLHDARFLIVLVPPGMPPRTTIGYLFIPLLNILERLKWTNIHKQNYDELLEVLNDIRDRYRPEVTLSQNPAKALSQKLVGKIPLIYGVEGKTDVVAHRLKTQINENSKIIDFWDNFP